MNSLHFTIDRLKQSIFSGLILAAAVVLLTACFSFPPQTGISSGTPGVEKSKITPTRRSLATTQTPKASPTPPLSEELQVNLGDLRGTKVVLWQPFVGEMGSLITKMAQEFSRENEWGIQAEAVMLGSDEVISERINQAAAEDLPQVVLATSEQLNAWLMTERLAALNPYLDSTTVQLDKRIREGFSPVFWQQDQFDGQQAGIPALRTAYGLFYNKTWANELGFTTPPVTTTQFRQQACEAAKVNNRSEYLEKRGTGGWLVDMSPEVTLSWLQAFGLEAIPTEEGGDYHFAQEKGNLALAYLRKMQEDGCLWVGKNPTSQQYFADRYALFISGDLQDLASQAKMMEGVENNDEWVFLGYPASSGGPFINSAGYSYGLISTDPKQQMAGWLFMRWLSQPENQARLGAIYPSLPISSAWQDQAADYRVNFPWTMILPLENNRILPVPSLPSWQVARRPVGDAGWQLYNLASADQLPEILSQLDALIKDLLAP